MLRGHRDLKVYQLAYELAMEVYVLSKTFPQEERFALTSQIRRSSRSVVANIAEGFRKRQYPNMFVSKLADSDAEAPRLRYGSTSPKAVATCQNSNTTI